MVEAKTTWVIGGRPFTFPQPVTREWVIWFLKNWPKMSKKVK